MFESPPIYFNGFWSTELKTTPASLVFIEITRDIKELKFIIEKGLDIEKATIKPRENKKASLNLPFQKMTRITMGRDIKAVIFVPAAKPNRTDDKNKEKTLILLFFEYKYLIRKYNDVVTSEVR